MLYCKIIYVFCANHANALNVLWRKKCTASSCCKCGVYSGVDSFQPFIGHEGP